MGIGPAFGDVRRVGPRLCQGEGMTPTLDARLAEKIAVQANGCWLWTGAHSTGGYGRVRVSGKQQQAHRVVYEALAGPIPEGLTLDHLCRRRDCVRPEHLEPVTNAENVRRGSGPTARNARKTHCPKGHEYTPENTYAHPQGRECLTCKVARRRAWGIRPSG